MRNPDVKVKTVLTPSGVGHWKIDLEASISIFLGLENTCRQTWKGPVSNFWFVLGARFCSRVPFWATHRPSLGDASVSQTFQACRQRECPWKCPCVDGTRGGCYLPPPCHPRCTQPQAGNITQRFVRNTWIGLIQSVRIHNNAEMQHQIKNTTCVFINKHRKMHK